MTDGIMPNGWTSIALESLLDFVIGGDWGKDPDYEDDEFVEVKCIRGTEFRNWKTDRGKTASLRKVKKNSLNKRGLQLGDILLEISGGGPDQPVGRTEVVDKRVLSHDEAVPKVPTNFLRLVRPGCAVESTYLNYYLKKFYLTGEVTNYQSGSNNLRNLQFKDYQKIAIPLPPLAEQTRIANKLDELLAQVETIKARVDAIPGILKRFRQSVLAAAVSGRLTEEWRGNSGYTESAEGVLHPVCWEYLFIDDIAEVKGGKRLPKGEKLVGRVTPYPYIKAGQLKNGTVEPAGQEYLEPHIQQKIARYIIRSGDAYITIVGACIGDAGLVPLEYDGANLTENAAKLCGFKRGMDGSYLSAWLRSKALQDIIKFEIKSGAQGKLALKRIKTLPIPFPPIEEQKEISRLVVVLNGFADQIEVGLDAAQARVNGLTQSILAKAFRGELVPQDPDDEPASVLLERIEIERQEARTIKKTIGKSLENRIGSSPGKKLDKNKLKEWLINFQEDRFSYEILEKFFDGTTEQIESVVYTLLEEKNPIIEQTFDSETGYVLFKKIQQ